MIESISPDESRRMLLWLNRNRKKLARYHGQYVAYSKDELLSHGLNLSEVQKAAEETKRTFAIYLVPRHGNSMVLLPIRLHSISRHEWRPDYHIILKHGGNEVRTTMLVDSGADFSVISNKAGYDLGYALADSERTLIAFGIGGTVEYVLRNIGMTIDGHFITAPVAWLQDDGVDEMILGREVVFDHFNIEFIQAEERIVFRRREERGIQGADEDKLEQR